MHKLIFKLVTLSLISTSVFAGTVCSTDAESTKFLKAEKAGETLTFSICKYTAEDLKKSPLYRHTDKNAGCQQIEVKSVLQHDKEHMDLMTKQIQINAAKVVLVSMSRVAGVAAFKYGIKHILGALASQAVAGTSAWNLFLLNTNEPKIYSVADEVFAAVSNGFSDLQYAKSCQFIEATDGKIEYVIKNLKIISSKDYAKKD